jgi:hypothetical protein
MDPYPNTRGQQFMESERRLLADLNDFNTKYNRYILCNNDYINPYNNTLKCSPEDLSKNTMVVAYNKLLTTSVIDVSNGLTVFKKDPNTISPAVYDASYQYIKKTYKNDVVKVRNDLDMKMQELYGLEGTIRNEKQKQYDTTMYIGLLWTVLATSGLYFVFTKL